MAEAGPRPNSEAGKPGCRRQRQRRQTTRKRRAAHGTRHRGRPTHPTRTAPPRRAQPNSGAEPGTATRPPPAHSRAPKPGSPVAGGSGVTRGSGTQRAKLGAAVAPRTPPAPRHRTTTQPNSGAEPRTATRPPPAHNSQAGKPGCQRQRRQAQERRAAREARHRGRPTHPARTAPPHHHAAELGRRATNSDAPAACPQPSSQAGKPGCQRQRGHTRKRHAAHGTRHRGRPTHPAHTAPPHHHAAELGRRATNSDAPAARPQPNSQAGKPGCQRQRRQAQERRAAREARHRGRPTHPTRTPPPHRLIPTPCARTPARPTPRRPSPARIAARAHRRPRVLRARVLFLRNVICDMVHATRSSGRSPSGPLRHELPRHRAQFAVGQGSGTTLAPTSVPARTEAGDEPLMPWHHPPHEARVRAASVPQGDGLCEPTRHDRDFVVSR
ncbi:hypothetical protein ABIA38_004906 [Embleya sp. AB8]